MRYALDYFRHHAEKMRKEKGKKPHLRRSFMFDDTAGARQEFPDFGRFVSGATILELELVLRWRSWIGILEDLIASGARMAPPNCQTSQPTKTHVCRCAWSLAVQWHPAPWSILIHLPFPGRPAYAVSLAPRTTHQTVPNARFLGQKACCGRSFATGHGVLMVIPRNRDRGALIFLIIPRELPLAHTGIFSGRSWRLFIPDPFLVPQNYTRPNARTRGSARRQTCL